MDYKIITIEDVKNDENLLKKVLNCYNSQNKYRHANKEKFNENSKNYYYKVNNKKPKTEKKTEDIKAYQKEYREKMKQKRLQLKEDLENHDA